MQATHSRECVRSMMCKDISGGVFWCMGWWMECRSSSIGYFRFQYLIILFSNVLFECETGQRVNEIPVTEFSSTACPSIKRFPYIDTFWWFKISSWKREFSQCVRDPKRKNINWKNVCVGVSGGHCVSCCYCQLRLFCFPLLRVAYVILVSFNLFLTEIILGHV
jgi:hypothetical protein